MLITALFLVAALRPIMWLCCHLASPLVLDILVVFTLFLLDAFPFSTIFSSRGLSLVPLKPSGRTAHPSIRWLLERKPFLPLDHLLLYFLFFVTLAETCSSPLCPCPISQHLKIPLRHCQGRTRNGECLSLRATCSLLSPTLPSRRFCSPTYAFVWLCFRRLACLLREVCTPTARC